MFFGKMAKGKTLNTMPTFQHGGGSIMFWGSFSSSGVRSLHKVEGIMKTEDYLTFANLYEGRC